MENHELELITDLFGRNPRQGPGSDAATKKALDLSGIDLNKTLNILDLGCGAGAQTIALARFTKGNITAVDLSEHLLKLLDKKISDFGLTDRIKTLKASMDQLLFESSETFDLIWSEGAIYNIGFEEGIRYLKSFLKPGGFMALSEISWLSSKRPDTLEKYWNDYYPGIDIISGNTVKLEKHGYKPTAHFILTDECWMDEFYDPLKKVIPEFLKQHDNDPLADSLIESEMKEMQLYKTYKDHYGYVFYIAQKP